MQKIAAALLEAQKEMGNAIKESSNPFFKSKYADLNSVREATIPILNKHGISIIQPMTVIEGKNYILTVLLHTSGEKIESYTEIIYSRQNDAQSQGSGITYARRYGLQSLVCIGAEDDDGAMASNNQEAQKKETEKKWLNENTEQFQEAVKYLADGGKIETIKKKYSISKKVEQLLIDSILG